MEAKKYLTCLCEHCGSDVSFPYYAAGGVMICPTCQQQTHLTDPLSQAVTATPRMATQESLPSDELESPPETDLPTPAAATASRRGLVAVMGVLAFAAVGAFLFWKYAPSAKSGSAARPPEVAAALEKSKSSAPERTAPTGAKAALAADKPDRTTAPASAAAAAKSIEDLKIGPVTLQQPKGTRGSRLVYAVGAVKNASDVQRLGIKIELDLLDAAGNKIDASSDYCPSLAGQETWRFRALVHDPRVVSARVASIKEDE